MALTDSSRSQYIAVIAIVWHIPYVKYVLYPFKMLTIAFHEFSHAVSRAYMSSAAPRNSTHDIDDENRPRDAVLALELRASRWILEKAVAQ